MDSGLLVCGGGNDCDWHPLAQICRCEASPSDSGEPVFSGTRDCIPLRPGCALYHAQWQQRQDARIQLQLKPALRFFLKLGGGFDLLLDGVPMWASASDSSAPVGVMSLATERVMLSAADSAGDQKNDLWVISVQPHWLESMGVERDCWRAIPGRTPRVVEAALARQGSQLVKAAEEGQSSSLAFRLRVEAFIFGVLADFIEQQPVSADLDLLRQTDVQQLGKLKDFLDSGQADGMSLPEIARHFACNINSLQRRFKSVYGRTIGEYLRASRLLRAARKIEKEGISIAMAAELAGYGSQANFSTAFRRCFGFSPKQARKGMVGGID